MSVKRNSDSVGALENSAPIFFRAKQTLFITGLDTFNWMTDTGFIL
jgi:hypothetical protein